MQNGSTPFSRVIYDYSALLKAFSDRSRDLQISREELDRLAGLADRHASKLIAPNPTKTFGMKSLGDVLGALGLILIVVEDPAAAARTLARREPVNTSNQRFGNTNASKKRIEPEAKKTAIGVAMKAWVGGAPAEQLAGIADLALAAAEAEA